MLDEFKEVSDKGLTRLKRLGASGVAKSIDFYADDISNPSESKTKTSTSLLN